MKTFTSHSLDETKGFAEKWLEEISKKTVASGDQAFVVGLSGHLGAGKTAFVKVVAKILGVHEEITSPSFVIMKKYAIAHPQWKHLIHIDAYRLEHQKELEVLDFESLVSDPGNLIMIEWPEKVGLDGGELGVGGLDALLKFEAIDRGHQISQSI